MRSESSVLLAKRNLHSGRVDRARSSVTTIANRKNTFAKFSPSRIPPFNFRKTKKTPPASHLAGSVFYRQVSKFEEKCQFCKGLNKSVMGLQYKSIIFHRHLFCKQIIFASLQQHKNLWLVNPLISCSTSNSIKLLHQLTTLCFSHNEVIPSPMEILILGDLMLGHPEKPPVTKTWSPTSRKQRAAPLPASFRSA